MEDELSRRTSTVTHRQNLNCQSQTEHELSLTAKHKLSLADRT